MLFNAAFLSWRYWVPKAAPIVAPARAADSEPLLVDSGSESDQTQPIRLLDELAKTSQVEPTFNSAAKDSAVSSSKDNSASRDNRISPAPGTKKIDESQQVTLAASTSVKDSVLPKLCYLAGPFKSPEVRDKMVARLREKSVHAAGQEKIEFGGWRYWVYLHPASSRKEASRELARVQALGLDSYLIQTGSLANGISLGLYSSDELAESKMKEYRRLGLDPKLNRYQKESPQSWLAASKSQVDAAAGEFLASWRASESKLQVIEKKCELPVASH